MLLSAFLCATAGQAATVSVTVPGTANPWLSGLPSGSTDNGSDGVPAESPAPVTGLSLTPGNTLTFAATGAVDNAGATTPVDPPDGQAALTAHTNGATNGLSDVTAPVDALMGVFVGGQPNLNAAPAALDFSSAASQDYTTLAPALQQVFFIGDGQTSGGVTQHITVPTGATRLFLGTMDGGGWYNNTGSFTVQVTSANQSNSFVLSDPVSVDAQGDAMGNAADPGSTIQNSNSETQATRRAISGDGRYVVFTSNASNLVPNDNNGQDDVFLRDRQTGVTTLVSVNSAGTDSGTAGPNNGGAYDPTISDDGRYVAFISDDTDLVAGLATNSSSQVYVRDMQTGITVLASPSITASSAASSNSDCQVAIISGNGQFVVFLGIATDLTTTPSGNANAGADIFVRDLQNNNTILVSVNKDGTAGSEFSGNPDISDDGHIVAFESTASDLVPTDTNGQADVFTRDLQTNTTTLVSVNSAGTDSGNDGSYCQPSLSADGTKVVFTSYAKNLVTGVTQSTSHLTQVFARDLTANVTTMVSVDPAGTTSANYFCFTPVLSGNGNFVAFATAATNLVTSINVSGQHVYERNLPSATTALMDVSPDGSSNGNATAADPTVSDDGRYVAFATSANNLVAGTGNTNSNIYVRDTQTQTTALLSSNATATDGANGVASTPIISGGGKAVVFETNATNYATNIADTNQTTDVLAARVIPGVPVTASTLQFSAPTYSIGEAGGQATITVTRIGGTSSTATVAYNTAGGTATDNVDFSDVSGTLTFVAGVTSKTFTVPITNDSIPEANETINLTLSSSTGSGVTLGNPSTAVLTIIDDDPAGVLQFDTSSYNAGEGQYAVVNVVRSNGSNGTVTVDYATSDGTAKAGTDYLTATGTLSFAPGETSKQIIVQTPNVPGYQGNRSFSIMLSNATGRASIGQQNAANITITEAEQPPVAVPVGTLQFSASAYSVAENVLGNQMVVYVTRSTASLTPVTVNYSTADGTAKAGTDYTATSGTLTFNNGDQQLYFFVPIVNDAVYEGNRAFTVALGNPTNGATLGTPNTATVTIVDDETPPPPVNPGTFQFSTANFTVNQDGSGDGSGADGLANILVTRANGTDTSPIIGISITDGTAKAGAAYKLPTAANLPLGSTIVGNVVYLQFAPGESSKLFTIPLINDTIAQAPRFLSLAIVSHSAGTSLGTTTTSSLIINDNNPGATVNVTLAGAPTASGPPNTVYPSEQINYDLTYTVTGSTALNVSIQDTLPTGVTLLQATGRAPDGSALPASAISTAVPGVVTWNIGNVPPGTTSHVFLNVQVNSTDKAGQVITNSKYSITSSSNPLAGTTPVTFTVAGPYSLTMTPKSAKVNTGDIVTYNIVATDNRAAGSPIGHIAVTAPIPAGTAFVSAFFVNSSGTAITAPANPNLPSPIAGGTFTSPQHNPEIITDSKGQQYAVWWFNSDGKQTELLQLNVQVKWDDDPATDSPIKNTVQLVHRLDTGSGYENLGNASASVTIGGTGTGAPVLGLSNDATSPAGVDSFANPIVLPGQTITYTFLAFNQGPTKAENVMLYDTFVATADTVKPTYVPGSFKLNGNTVSDSALTFQTLANSTSLATNLTDIGPGFPAAGAAATVQFQVKVPITAKAGISITSLCHLQADNLNAATFGSPAPLHILVVNPVSFSIQKSADVAVAQQGDKVTYTIGYANNGDVAASSVDITDVLPAGLAFASASFAGLPTPTVAPKVGAGGTVRWHLTSIPKQTKGTVRVQASVTADPTKTSSVSNTATITNGSVTATSQPVITHITGPTTTRVSIATSAPLSVPGVGQRFTYTITYNNMGNAPDKPVAAQNVKVELNIPFAHVQVINQSGYPTTPGYSRSGSNFIWSLGTLPSNTVKALQVSVLVQSDPGASGLVCQYSHITASNAAGIYTPPVVTSVVPPKFFGLFSVARASDLTGQVTPKNALTDFVAWLWNGLGSFFNWIGSGIGGLANALKAGGHKGQAVQSDLSKINANSLLLSIGGADTIRFPSGVIVTPIGDGKFEVSGPASLIHGGSIVAQGGGNVTAQGDGNAISITGVGLIGQNGNGIVAQGGGNITAKAGGDIVAQGGGNFVGQNGSAVISNDGGSALGTIKSDTPGLVDLGNGNGFAAGGGNVINTNGSNIVAQGGGNIVAQGGGNIVAQGGGNIVAQGGGNIVAQGGGNIVAQGGGN